MEQLEDLNFADIVFISTTRKQMQKMMEKMTEIAQRTGLNISKTKIHALKMNYKNNEPLKFWSGSIMKPGNSSILVL